MNLSTSKISFETKVNVFEPLNTVGKSSFVNVAGLLDPSLDCDEFTL